MIKRKPESGALGNPVTARVLRAYSWRLILSAFGAVAIANVVGTALNELDPPDAVHLVFGVLVIALTLTVLGCLSSYVRLLLMRKVLRSAEWQPISGVSRTVAIGPLPLARVIVADLGGDTKPEVDYVGPVRFSRRLPTDLVPANMMVAQWGRLRVYSTFDGASPALGVPVLFPLRRLLRNTVMRGL